MPQRDARLIGGVYRVGQVITSSDIFTTCTAYNRNTGDVVGLFIIEIPPTIQPEVVRTHLDVLGPRRFIQSPHVARIYDWGIDDTRVYIAANPPRGVTLQHVLDNENIDIARALDLTQQIALGLQALHEHEIVGIDLRPQLITIDSDGIHDRVQIDDIGLRLLLHHLGYRKEQQSDDISSLDPQYTAPEYINQTPIGPWSDIYQLGLLLFTLITGRLPFVGRNHAETGIMQTSSPIPRMIQFKHDTPSSLQDLIDCMMNKEPSKRFAHATALLIALEALKLPTRRPTTNQHPEQYTQHMPSALGLTNEMTPVEKVSQQATRIEKRAVPQNPSDTLLSTIPSETETLAYLCYERTGSETQRFAIRQKTVIVGRSDPKRGYTPEIDLSLPDTKMMVSRQHARIRFEETFFSVEDLKSRNKTRLGNQVLEPFKAEVLHHGDMLYFGNVRLIFEIPGY